MLNGEEPQRKPCNVVKPYGFEHETEDKGDIVIIIDDDEVVVIDDDEVVVINDDDEEEEQYKNASQDLTIINTSSTCRVNVTPLSEETIRKYSLVKGCYVTLQRCRQAPVLDGKTRRRRSSDSESLNPEPSTSGAHGYSMSDDSTDDSEDDLYTPYGYTKKGAKRTRTPHDTNYVPDGPHQLTRKLNQTVPLNKSDRNSSRGTFCERLVDMVESTKSSGTAVKLCQSYWNNLSDREKRKYLPRSKFAHCYFDDADTRRFQE